MVKTWFSNLLNLVGQNVTNERRRSCKAQLNSFRLACIMNLGELLACDNKIAEHITIAEEMLTKKMLLARLGVFIGPIAFPFFALTLISLILVKSPAASYIFMFISFISQVPLFFISYMLLIRYKRRAPISLMVVSLIYVIISINMLKEKKYNFDIDQIDTSKINMDQLNKVLDDLEEVYEDYKLIEKKSTSKSEGNSEEVIDILESKRWVLSNLEEAARYAEYYIPHQLKSGDITTDNLFKKSMQWVAAALREKKMWVLTPMEDTYSLLIARMISTLDNLVNDNWDALERLEPSKATRRTLIYVSIKFLVTALKALFIASLPLLMFLVFQLVSPLTITGTVRDYVLIGVFLWFGLTVLVSVDSAVTTKFSLLKDTKALLTLRQTDSKL